MVVPIMLIGAAEREQMVALQQGKIVAEHVVMPVPEAPADLLVVYVKRAKVLSLGLAAIQFERAAETSDLGWSSVSCPRPPVPQEAVMEVVGQVGGEVGGQSGNEIPVLNRIARCRGWGTQLITGKEAAYVDLFGAGNLDVVIAPAGVEVVLGAEIVIDTRYMESAGDGRIQIASESQYIVGVAQALAAGRV